MNKKEILAMVRDRIASILDQPSLAVTMRTTSDDVTGWDSFNHINIVLAMETEFGIKFNASEVEELHAVGALVDLIEKKLANKK